MAKSHVLSLAKSLKEWVQTTHADIRWARLQRALAVFGFFGTQPDAIVHQLPGFFFPVRSPALYLNAGCPDVAVLLPQENVQNSQTPVQAPSYLYLEKVWLTRATQLINLEGENSGLPDFQAEFPSSTLKLSKTLINHFCRSNLQDSLMGKFFFPRGSRESFLEKRGKIHMCGQFFLKVILLQKHEGLPFVRK